MFYKIFFVLLLCFYLVSNGFAASPYYKVDPIVKTESLKNKVVSLEDSVDVFIFLSLSVGAPSETPLRHCHFQVQQ